jgi:hypothetical protein
MTDQPACQIRFVVIHKLNYEGCFTIDDKSSSAVRISMGMVTNFNEVQSFLLFTKGLLG